MTMDGPLCVLTVVDAEKLKRRIALFRSFVYVIVLFPAQNGDIPD